MKPMSMWITLGMGLFLVLSMEAIAQPPTNISSGTLFGDPGIATLKQNVPSIPGSTNTATTIITSNSLNPILGGSMLRTQPNIGAQPEPPEIFNANVSSISQDPTAPTTNLIIREDDVLGVLESNH